MTRRERHIRIIESWRDSSIFRFCRGRVVALRGLAAFNDETIEELARSLVDGRRRQQKMNKQNRELRAAP